MIVYYYPTDLQITSSGVMPSAWENLLDDTTFFTIGNQAYCLAGDRHQCSDRSRIFDRRLIGPKSILPAGSAPTDASFIFAMYAAARTIPLAFIALIAIYKHSEPALLILGTLAGFIKLLDAEVGLLRHDPGKSIGPFVIAAFQFFAVYFLIKPTRSSVE
jgi:hypothetical protein